MPHHHWSALLITWNSQDSHAYRRPLCTECMAIAFYPTGQHFYHWTIFKRPRITSRLVSQEILKKRFDIHSSAFLDSITGIGSFPHRDYAIPVSEPERAILEYLYLCPKEGSLSIAYHMMDMLVALRPDLVQILLNECNSIKVKRLFLYLAETQNHAWFDILKKTTIDLGSGKRVLPQGKLDRSIRLSWGLVVLNEYYIEQVKLLIRVLPVNW